MVNSMNNSLTKEQVKSSTISGLYNCLGTGDNLANKSQNEVKSGKSQRNAVKLANTKCINL